MDILKKGFLLNPLCIDIHSLIVTMELGPHDLSFCGAPRSRWGSLSFLEIDVYGASTDGQLQIGDRDRAGGRSACRRVRHERGRAEGEEGLSGLVNHSFLTPLIRVTNAFITGWLLP